VTFKGDPSIKRIAEMKSFVSKLKDEADEANRVATFDAFTSANSGSGGISFISVVPVKNQFPVFSDFTPFSVQCFGFSSCWMFSVCRVL